MSKLVTTILAIVALVLLSGCSEGFVPHPEMNVEMNDFMRCMKKTKGQFPDPDYGAYICHVAVEDREWMDWKGYPRENFK